MPTRGTTPYYTIHFDGIELDQIDDIYVTFSQPRKGNILTVSNVERTAEGFYIHLTQEQTLSLDRGSIYMQIRFTDVNGEAYATEQWDDEVSDVLQEGVI